MWILRSSTCAGHFQTLFPGCAGSCSLETLLLQVFVLIKARDMNMQDSKHHGRLLAKFIRICEWLCRGNVLAELIQLSNSLNLTAKPLYGADVMVICFIAV